MTNEPKKSRTEGIQPPNWKNSLNVDAKLKPSNQQAFVDDSKQEKDN